jgi:hypothetical protein
MRSGVMLGLPNTLLRIGQLIIQRITTSYKGQVKNIWYKFYVGIYGQRNLNLPRCIWGCFRFICCPCLPKNLSVCCTLSRAYPFLRESSYTLCEPLTVTGYRQKTWLLDSMYTKKHVFNIFSLNTGATHAYFVRRGIARR